MAEYKKWLIINNFFLLHIVENIYLYNTNNNGYI